MKIIVGKKRGGEARIRSNICVKPMILGLSMALYILSNLGAKSTLHDTLPYE
jgi:hypothetical protein